MLYIIMGQSGCGKDTIVSKINSELSIPVIRETTTRPRRCNENEEVYHFVSDKEFDDLIDRNLLAGYFIAENGWKYGIKYTDLNKYNDALICTNPSCYKMIKKQLDMRDFIGIFVHMDDKQRILNAINREEHPNVSEVCRRFLSDENDFREIQHSTELWHIDNNSSLSFTMDQINFIIKSTR